MLLCFYFDETKETDRLQPEHDRDLLLRADGNQVVGQKLAG